MAACANVLTGMVDSWLPGQDQSIPDQAFTGRRLRQIRPGVTSRHLLQASYAGGIVVLTQVPRPILALHCCAPMWTRGYRAHDEQSRALCTR